jgi:hypothetical protein
MVELAEDERHQDIAGGDGALRIGSLNGFEAGKSTLIVEVVEVLVGFADLGREVDGIGVGSRIVGLRCGRQWKQEGEKECPKYFYAVMYRYSPERRNLVRRNLFLV